MGEAEWEWASERCQQCARSIFVVIVTTTTVITTFKPRRDEEHASSSAALYLRTLMNSMSAAALATELEDMQ